MEKIRHQRVLNGLETKLERQELFGQGQRMDSGETGARGKRGRAQGRFIDIAKEDMQRVGDRRGVSDRVR